MKFAKGALLLKKLNLFEAGAQACYTFSSREGLRLREDFFFRSRAELRCCWEGLPGTRRGVELLEMLGRIPRTMSNTCPWAAATFMCVLRIWVQISENFKMKAENTAKIPKFSILAF